MRALTIIPGKAGSHPGWLGALITRRHPLTGWATALEKRKDDVKVVLEP